MDESYDVGVLLHFPDDISQRIKLDLIELADKWEGYAEGGWPFAVALIPMGDYLAFVFPDPDNANLFISHAEKYLQAVENEEDIDLLYSDIFCWTGLVGGGEV